MPSLGIIEQHVSQPLHPLSELFFPAQGTVLAVFANGPTKF